MAKNEQRHNNGLGIISGTNEKLKISKTEKSKSI